MLMIIFYKSLMIAHMYFILKSIIVFAMKLNESIPSLIKKILVEFLINVLTI